MDICVQTFDGISQIREIHDQSQYNIQRTNNKIAVKRMQTLEQKLKVAISTRNKAIFTGIHKQSVKPSKNFIALTKERRCLEQVQANLSDHQKPDTEAERSSIGKKLSSLTPKVANQYSQYQYSSIGLIVCEQAGQTIMGTGFLVGANYVLTSAQNIWSFKERKVSSNVSFSPAFKNSSESHTYHAKRVHIPEELKDGQSSADELLGFNFAVIELDCGNLEHQYGIIALSFAASTIANQQVAVVGYACYGKNNGLCELSSVAFSDDEFITYEANVSYGICGAPILQSIEGELEVVGIHVYSRQRQGKVQRGGIRLSPKMLEYLEKWCIQEEVEVDLREKGLRKEGLKQLSRHKWNNLSYLNISRNGLQSSSAKYLKSGEWRDIIEFDLGGNQIKKEGAQALAQSSLSRVATLNLWGNGIGKKGAYFLSLTNWEQLTNLNLYNNDLGDEGLQFLIKANWPKLNNLNLGKNEITAAGARRILEGKWVKLASLNLWGNSLNGEEASLKEIFLQHFKSLKFLYL